MVLDSKQMDWASREGLDTAALKKAKVPIFGKWYFPDLPANVPLVNLSTGEVETFPAGYRAGAVLYVKEDDLKRAGLGPYKAVAAPAPVPVEAAPEPAAPGPAAEPVAVAAAPAAPARPSAAPAPAPTAAPPPASGQAFGHAPAPAAHAAPAPRAPSHGPSHGVGPTEAAHAAEHAHPGARTYITIALILCVITAIEVWVYYVPALLPYIFPILIVLSTLKFVLVVGWFMHLKFDHSSYTWYFGGGLALALSIFGGLVLLQIATHGLPPGDGHATTHPSTYPGAAPAAPNPAGGGGH